MCPEAEHEAESPNALKREFVADHRVFTRGLTRVIDAVRNNEWARAVAEAKALNREAGPHIAFEESRLYPHVERWRGEGFVDNLYDEHRVAIRAVRFLIEHPDPAGVTPEERRNVIEGLQTGLEHAVVCGSLLSYLTVLDDDEQAQFLDELNRCRVEGKTLLDFEVSAR